MNEAKTPTTEEIEERGYIEGQRAAWRDQLRQALQQLRGYGAGDDAEAKLAIAALELDETREALRKLCGVYGDNNDWKDGDHLRDVVEGLHCRLDEAQGG